MTFNNGSPQNFSDWIDDGFIIIPCKNKVPVVKWKDENFKSTKDQWAKLYKGCNIGLKLVGLTDIDIDNHFVKKFIEKYLKSCGSIYGRETNPRSHYLFLGELNSKKFCLPDELSEYFKGFPHGSTILEIRSGKGHQSIVPNSIIDKDFVAWDRFAKINSYEGDLESDIGKIALSSALSILYPLEGKRDDYCTAIAGVLAKHTDWNEDAINEFVYNLAVLSGSRNPERYMSKGTNAKKSTGNKFGMPTIAEKVGCSVKTISELFSWVGVKDSGSLFKELRVYKTEPKYWQIKYKDQWITVMHTSELSAYSKISNLIMENCYELAPAITPKEWRAILGGLLQNVQKIDAPIESSYMGVVGGLIIDYLQRSTSGNQSKEDFRHDLGSFGACTKFEDHYWFKLEGIMEVLKRKHLSFEMRKLTHFLREEFGCVPTKLTIDKKELRVWKVPCSNLDDHARNNTDMEGWSKITKERVSKINYKEDTPY